MARPTQAQIDAVNQLVARNNARKQAAFGQPSPASTALSGPGMPPPINMPGPPSLSGAPPNAPPSPLALMALMALPGDEAERRRQQLFSGGQQETAVDPVLTERGDARGRPSTATQKFGVASPMGRPGGIQTPFFSPPPADVPQGGSLAPQVGRLASEASYNPTERMLTATMPRPGGGEMIPRLPPEEASEFFADYTKNLELDRARREAIDVGDTAEKASAVRKTLEDVLTGTESHLALPASPGLRSGALEARYRLEDASPSPTSDIKADIARSGYRSNPVEGRRKVRAAEHAERERVTKALIENPEGKYFGGARPVTDPTTGRVTFVEGGERGGFAGGMYPEYAMASLVARTGGEYTAGEGYRPPGVEGPTELERRLAEEGFGTPDRFKPPVSRDVMRLAEKRDKDRAAAASARVAEHKARMAAEVREATERQQMAQMARQSPELARQMVAEKGADARAQAMMEIERKKLELDSMVKEGEISQQQAELALERDKVNMEAQLRAYEIAQNSDPSLRAQAAVQAMVAANPDLDPIEAYKQWLTMMDASRAFGPTMPTFGATPGAVPPSGPPMPTFPPLTGSDAELAELKESVGSIAAGGGFSNLPGSQQSQPGVYDPMAEFNRKTKEIVGGNMKSATEDAIASLGESMSTSPGGPGGLSELFGQPGAWPDRRMHYLAASLLKMYRQGKFGDADAQAVRKVLLNSMDPKFRSMIENWREDDPPTRLLKAIVAGEPISSVGLTSKEIAGTLNTDYQSWLNAP